MAKCPKIDRKVTFYYEGEPIGRLRPEPISDQETTKSPEELLAHQREPVFIDAWGDWKCFYVFQGNKSALKKALFGNLPSSSPQSMLTVPTGLETTVSEGDGGDFYFPDFLYFNSSGRKSDRAIFMSDYRGLPGALWYLAEMGSLNQALNATTQLVKEWEDKYKDPTKLFENAEKKEQLYEFPAFIEAELSLLRGSDEDEFAEIEETNEIDLNNFLGWFESNYPLLYEQIGSQIQLLPPDEIEELLGNSKFRGNLVPQSYLSAIAVRGTDKITIMPKGIFYLREGDYQGLVSAIAHENGHMDSFEDRSFMTIFNKFLEKSLAWYGGVLNLDENSKKGLEEKAVLSGARWAFPVDEIWSDIHKFTVNYDQVGELGYREEPDYKKDKFYYYERNWALLENYFPRSLLYMVRDYLYQKMKDHPHPLNELFAHDIEARIAIMEAYPAFDEAAPDPNDNMAYQELRDTFGLDSSLSEE